MSFSNHLRKLAQSIWDAQLNHPFVVALGNGTLPERKFKYYILQDARFLGDLSRVFAAGAMKAPDSESALRLAKLAEDTIVVERSLHENYGKRWKLTAKQMSSVPMAPDASPLGARNVQIERDAITQAAEAEREKYEKDEAYKLAVNEFTEGQRNRLKRVDDQYVFNSTDNKISNREVKDLLGDYGLKESDNEQLFTKLRAKFPDPSMYAYELERLVEKTDPLIGKPKYKS